MSHRSDHAALAEVERFTRRSIRATQGYLAELVMTARRRSHSHEVVADSR